ncbi:Uncharacterised protein [uncultured archaeon]|nr:Uncharacterised protein [uncultured archaeon]
MKRGKKDIFLLIILIGLLVLPFISSSNVPVVKPDLTSIKIGDTPEQIGDLIGLPKDQINIQNADFKKTGDTVEVTLRPGGKMNFGGELKNSLGDSIDSKYLDFSKSNKFVFENGKLTEAKFSTKFFQNILSYSINGAKFDVPGKSDIDFKNNNVKVNVKETSLTHTIWSPQYEKGKGPSVNYVVSKGGEIAINNGGKYSLPIQEGEIGFSAGNGDNVVLYGEKIILAGGKQTDDGYNTNTMLNGLEIKNPDPIGGTSLYLGHYDIKTDKPYINIESQISTRGDNLIGCVAAVECGDSFISGYNVRIGADSKGNAPTINFNFGNPIFPGMNPEQSISIFPGSSKLDIQTYFDSADNGEKVSTTITSYSGDAKIINGKGTFAVEKIGTGDYEKYVWNVNRQNSGNYYPMTLRTSMDKGNGLTVYPDTISVEGSPVTIVRNFNLEETQGIVKPSVGEDLKVKAIDSISNVVEKIFGEKIKNKVEDKLYKWFFPRSLPV